MKTVFNDPVMHQLATKIGPLPSIQPAEPSLYFSHLVESILSQQLSVKASDTIIAHAKKLVNDSWEPKAVLSIDHETWRSAGLSNNKAKYLTYLAEFWETQSIQPEEYAQLDNEALIQHLVQVKGIGRWTVEMFLIFCLGRPDVFSAGDLGLRNAVTKAYGLTTHLTPNELTELSKPWSPNKSLAARILWKSLNNV